MEGPEEDGTRVGLIDVPNSVIDLWEKVQLEEEAKACISKPRLGRKYNEVPFRTLEAVNDRRM